MSELIALSVVIPAYREACHIHESLHVIDRVVQQIGVSYELICIDDGSPDLTWQSLKRATDSLENLQIIRLSRNFGKESAIIAGLEASRGGAVVVMDSDLQHPPNLIGSMYDRWLDGGQVVNAIKKKTNRDSVLHEFAAGLFYRTFQKITGADLANSSDFKLLDREVVDAYLRMPESQPFFRGIIQWMGYSQEAIEFEVQDRTEGESTFTIASLFRMAMEVIIGSSGILLQGATFAGAVSLLVGLFLVVKSVYQKAIGVAVEGFATVILLQFIFSSVILLGMGVIGLYLASIHRELKARPRFLVRETNVRARSDREQIRAFKQAA
ncbi:MAG: glycosyltransferase family 2 protein [Planctomycetota bacterium]